jgi:hypothetical protein
MTDQHSITPPSTIHPEMVDTYQELYSIVCAANHALKNMEGLLETSIDETKGYTFCDLSGDAYCIRKALQFLEASIKAQGLKGDPIV